MRRVFAKLFRWRAIVPLSLLLAGLVVGWILYLDRLVERGIEETGTRVVGARVDLASADVRLGQGALVLRGLQVTDPQAPMTNLFEAEEIVADVRVMPLLEQKAVVETLAVRGVRFGTQRETSGALDDPDPETGRIAREVTAWADGIDVPSFSLEGLSTVVDAAAIRPESLRTLAVARGVIAAADSMRSSWRDALRVLDPAPRIDSVRTLVERLRNANPLRLGIGGVRRLVGDARETVETMTTLESALRSLDSTAEAGLGQLRARTGALTDARRADYAYARGLLQLPSLEAPDISPALFGSAAIGWVKPVLYWLRTIERYLPPGLQPRRVSGPKRARLAGTTVQFPSERSYPRFWLEHGDVDVRLGGSGVEAGRYALRISDLSTAPALVGRPVVIRAERAEAVRGPRALRAEAILDHTAAPIRDSVTVLVDGLALPSLDIAPLGARLILGQGSTDLALDRRGDELSVRWRWRSADVRWERRGGGAAGEGEGGGSVGSPQWARDFLWRTVSGLNRVEIDVRLAGSVRRPSLTVHSNVADALAQSLRREVGREVERAEQRVRAEVDRLVAEQVATTRQRVATLREGIAEEVAGRLQLVEREKARLEEEIRRLTRGLPIPPDGRH